MSKFDDFYSTKSVTELLEKLKAARVSPETMDKEWLNALIIHLNARQLSENEKKTMEYILSADIEALKVDTEKEYTIQVEKGIPVAKNEVVRYTALKAVVGIISTLGYILFAVGIIALIYLASEDQAPLGFLALVISVVIGLFLLAFSNLIYVFIDIEYNTRMTREELIKNGK